MKLEHCDSMVTCNFDGSSFDNGIVESYSIGGSGCNAVIDNGEDIGLRITDYAELNGGFTVEQGAEFSIETATCMHSEIYDVSQSRVFSTLMPMPPQLITKLATINEQ